MSVLAIDERTFVGELTEHDIEARVKVLRVIAREFNYLTDPQKGGAGVKGDGGSVALSPHEDHCLLLTKLGDQRKLGRRCTCAYQSVREFERLLRVMREDRAESLVLVSPGTKASVRRLRWHVIEWYVNAQPVTRHFPLALKKGSKLALIRDQDGQAITTRPVTRVHRHPGAVVGLADAGLAWMAGAWSLHSEPMLPEALRASD